MLRRYTIMDDKNRIRSYRVVVRNTKSKTIEWFDVSDVLEDMDYDTKAIDALLEKMGCPPATQDDVDVVEVYFKTDTKPATTDSDDFLILTKDEFDFAVKKGLAFDRMQAIKKHYWNIHDYEVKV